MMMFLDLAKKNIKTFSLISGFKAKPQIKGLILVLLITLYIFFFVHFVKITVCLFRKFFSSFACHKKVSSVDVPECLYDKKVGACVYCDCAYFHVGNITLSQ